LLIVTYFIYARSSSSRHARDADGHGALLIFLVYVAAKQLALVTLLNLLSTLLSSIILIVVSSSRTTSARSHARRQPRSSADLRARRNRAVIDEVVAAATELARHRMGALIASSRTKPRRVRRGAGHSVESDGHPRAFVSPFVPDR